MHYVPGRSTRISTSVVTYTHIGRARASILAYGSRPFAHAHQERESGGGGCCCCCWIREYLIRRAETRNFTPSSVAYPKDLLEGKGITHPTVGSVCPSYKSARLRRSENCVCVCVCGEGGERVSVCTYCPRIICTTRLLFT
jgi:hypothetical protein